MERLGIFGKNLLLIVSFFLFQATHAQTSDSDALKAFDWLNGNWMRTTSKSNSYESWTKKSMYLFDGISYSVKDNDTIIEERIKIVKDGNDIFYIADVPHNPAPVAFKLTEMSENKFVFENKTHDFPQTVVYERIADDKFIATIAGIKKDGKASAYSFEFIKNF